MWKMEDKQHFLSKRISVQNSKLLSCYIKITMAEVGDSLMTIFSLLIDFESKQSIPIGQKKSELIR